MKFFRACHKETKEIVEFGLEDISVHTSDGNFAHIRIAYEGITHKQNTQRVSVSGWLKDYDLYYNHQGQWYPYKDPEGGAV